ncbi:MAG: hypothetical protein CMM07_26755 [Rhodopirellula sp.]|nr:hypothetical protein [Rhodopirellula sp.]
MEEDFPIRGWLDLARCSGFRGYEQRRLCLKGCSPDVKGLVCVLMQFESVLFTRKDNGFLWFGVYVL